MRQRDNYFLAPAWKRHCKSSSYLSLVLILKHSCFHEWAPSSLIISLRAAFVRADIIKSLGCLSVLLQRVGRINERDFSAYTEYPAATAVASRARQINEIASSRSLTVRAVWSQWLLQRRRGGTINGHAAHLNLWLLCFSQLHQSAAVRLCSALLCIFKPLARVNFDWNSEEKSDFEIYYLLWIFYMEHLNLYFQWRR